MVDCVFMILVVLQSAKRKHQSIWLAFCEFAKAHDSVTWELLYTKLQSIGFEGRVVSLIQSIYFNKCEQINLSEPLYSTQEVKQEGSHYLPCCWNCILPLGRAIDSTKLGVKLRNVMLTALFFADDLLLLSKTPKRGMNKLLRIVSRFCMDMHMKLETSKTYILTNALI